MADVSSNININLKINGDARDLETEFQKIVSEFRIIRTQLEDAINNPLSTSIEKVNEIRDGFYSAAEGLKNLGGDYLKNSATSLADTANKLDTINNADINNINRQFTELQAILEADNTKLANTASVANDIIERFNSLNGAVQNAFSGQTLDNANAQMIRLSDTVDKVTNTIQQNIFEKQAQDALEAAQKIERQNKVISSASEIWKVLKENSEFYSKGASEALEKDNAQRKENLRILAEQGAEIIRFNASISEAVKKYEDLADKERELNEASKSTDNDMDILKEAFDSGKDILGQFASHLGINTDKVSEFTYVLSKLSPEGAAAVVGIGAIVGTLKLLSEEANEAINTFKSFAVDTLKKMPDLFSDIASNGIDLFVDSLSNMKDMIDSAIESLEELSEYGIKTNNALFVMNNYLGNEGADNLHKYITELGRLKGINITEIESSMKGLYGSLSNMNLDAEGLANYSKAFVNFMNDLSVYQNTSIDSIAGQLESAISFGVLNNRSALAKALDITDVMIEQFNELSSVEERAQWILGRWPIFAAKYDEWLKTDQGKVTVLKNTWENLMSTVGQLALKAYAMVAPLLTQILNLVNSVLSGIYKLFNIDTDTGVTNTSSAYSSLADSIKNVGNAAKEAERKTASFDDVIQISDSKSGSDMSGAIGEAIDLAALLDEINSSMDKGKSLWEIWADTINQDIEKGDWFSAGKHFAQFIYEWLDQIDWSSIYKNINDFATNLGNFFNGLSSNKGAWLKIGETVGNIFNTITLGIKQFFKTFDGAQFGDSLGFMWKNMWDTFDEQQAAGALYEVFNDVFGIVAGFLDHGGFMSMAESITKTLTGFFANIAENGNASEYAQTLYDLVKNIFLSLANAVYTVVTDENTKKVIKEGISTLLQNLADDSGSLATDMITLVTSILDFIGETLVSPENVNKVVKFIKDFVDTIVQNKDKIVEALKPIISAISDGLKQLAESGAINELGDTIINILDESGIWDLIGQWMILQMQYKLEVWKAETIAKLGTVLYGIGDSLEFAWKNSVFNVLIQLARQLPSQLAEKFKEIWPAIKSALETIWNNFKSWWNNHFGGKNLIDIAIPDWIPAVGGKTWNFKIPALATGGIVTSSTIANIGEAGAEAVLPLQRNTEWMDSLANKLAEKMGDSNNTVNIDLSKCQKPFYTRSEMLETGEYIGQCLKLAGMNVSVVM